MNSIESISVESISYLIYIISKVEQNFILPKYFRGETHFFTHKLINILRNAIRDKTTPLFYDIGLDFCIFLSILIFQFSKFNIFPINNHFNTIFSF